MGNVIHMSLDNKKMLVYESLGECKVHASQVLEQLVNTYLITYFSAPNISTQVHKNK